MTMQILNYFLASIIAYLGLLLGIFLIKLAPEEQNPGKTYFLLLKKITFFLVIGFMLFFYNINFILLVALLFFIVILMINKKLNLEKSSLTYFFLGIVFFLSSKIINLFVIESILIFFYGIPTASLILNLKEKNYKSIFIKNLWFFVPVILLYFIF
ncbi:MAG TPA: hypothetical protein QGI22_00950 [Candidatus Woesearchaeota archaeon]|jgi:hypothetical protein|nr:hypothetical protein [Candidatus Woesearchaeota archaeon]HJN56513.1 hypothetical protein [Candidatus Woesearchaeota archaeon]|tara:strand:+ start:5073 stop:5540 length:468 start_codon:yes stop_codon:yes gene_type:complete